jgi:hypothetical protein
MMHPDYTKLLSTIDEVMHRTSAVSQRNDNWRLVNMLPTDLDLWLEKRFEETTAFFESIKARETLIIDHWRIEDGDKLYVSFRTEDGRQIPFLEPYTFHDFSKTVNIGASVYRSTDGHLQTQASFWDMRGMWLENKIRVPLDIYYTPRKHGLPIRRLVAQVSANDGMNYMGGSSSSIYFDNNREGLNFGDELSFGYSVGSTPKILYTVVLNDNYIQKIQIGAIQGCCSPPEPDTFAYSVDEPVWTGITYYVPTGNYETRKTNPYALV